MANTNKMEVSIFWFRRDLRLDDNCGLFHALKDDNKVIPIFIFDKNILNKLPKNDARVNFIHQQLQKIENELQKVGSHLQVFYGNPLAIYKDLIAKHNIKKVFTNADYEPYAIKRDVAIKELLNQNNIDFQSYKDQVIFEKSEIVKDDGEPYVVYTPFSKKWLEKFTEHHTKSYPSENYITNFAKNIGTQFLSLDAIHFEKSQQTIDEFDVSKTIIDAYEKTRNFPAIDGTSKLGPHLRFGTVSVRKMVEKASKSNNNTFLKELIWREFFMQILYHFPHTVTQSFKPKYDRIEWRNNKEEFEKWCKGNTGYPLVDAGMRELNETGFMHNRVRMLVGSFLCKHLLIDWRWGEAYFAEKLHDYEQASNIGNWQWVAGCGVDAAPYFRIFNPTTQIEKFDKNHAYIKKWVPEYQEFSYPKPMVDHKMARERCLKVYKDALN